MPSYAYALAFCALALAAGGCRGDAASPPEDAQREAVRRFWRQLDAATALRLKGDLLGAARAYETALAIDERHEDALYYLGQCQRALGGPLDARRTFTRLVEVNAASARGHLALGALLSSPDASEPQDLDAAERHLRRAHAINAEETGSILRLGEILLARGALEEAGRWLESAARTNPKSVEAAFLAGYVRWESRDRSGARRFLERALRAGHAEAPPAGVLGEGDRKSLPRQQAAPPPQAPMGRTLFGDHVRALPQDGLDDTAIDRLYHAVREARKRFARSIPPRPHAPPAG